MQQTLRLLLPIALGLAVALSARASDQNQLGAGNAQAERTGGASPLVQSATRLLVGNAAEIAGTRLREATLDGFSNRHTCIRHRIHIDGAAKSDIIRQLERAGLLNPADAKNITGGVQAGIFPPVVDEPSACPQLPLGITGTPGSNFGDHHSYPGGLAVHTAFNDTNSINLADTYRGIYAQQDSRGLPRALGSRRQPTDGFVDQDIILAAPIWHDWGKMLVFQWNADGTEFNEFDFGGDGLHDNFGAAGDSRTGAHHILGIAETMARGLAPELVITQACAHSAPTLGNEFKVVNWLRAAAIIARIDPVERGYLTRDAKGQLRLPSLRALANGVDLPASGQTNLLLEYQIHNLSDADFENSIAAVAESQVLLAKLAPQYGIDPGSVADFNNRFRNVAFAYLSPERLATLYSQGGLPAVTRELNRLRTLHVL